MKISKISARRPYMLRAFYDWLIDNQLTPHLVVDVNVPDVQVPLEYVRDGQIVLNIAPRAVGNLELGNEKVRFSARFGGIPLQVSVPMAAILAIYARENGAGTIFESEPIYGLGVQDTKDRPRTIMSVIDGDRLDNATGEQNNSPDDDPPPRGTRPYLRIIKSVIDGDRLDKASDEENNAPDDDPPPRGTRPYLRIVK
ncbi:ClpXP protease specificity-enhancing factor [Pantoea sp. Nvir]|nr:ClpXP protease specificity-enhancing factor [Pantoea sp. Nvir]CAJ0993378.1 hypothetical protein NVIRPANT_00983 [Pantoea sp. Nvir]